MFVWYVCVYVYLLRMCVCCVVLNQLVLNQLVHKLVLFTNDLYSRTPLLVPHALIFP